MFSNKNLKTLSATISLTASQYLKPVLISDCDISKHNFLLYNQVWTLEDLHNSVNQHFPNDQFLMLQNHAWMKDPFKVQNRPMDFNLKKCKQFIDMVSDFTLQVTFKKLPLLKLQRRISYDLKKLLKYSSLSNYISVRSSIFCYTSTKTSYHSILKADADMRNCLLLSQILKSFTEM